MTTSPTNRARAAGLIALALAFTTFALPVEAKTLAEIPVISGDSHDCYSKQETKWYFKDKGFSHIKVSRTHDDYIYKVSGWADLPKKEAVESLGQQSILSSKPRDEKIRYVFLFDACDYRIVEQLEPR